MIPSWGEGEKGQDLETHFFFLSLLWLTACAHNFWSLCAAAGYSVHLYEGSKQLLQSRSTKKGTRREKKWEEDCKWWWWSEDPVLVVAVAADAAAVPHVSLQAVEEKDLPLFFRASHILFFFFFFFSWFTLENRWNKSVEWCAVLLLFFFPTSSPVSAVPSLYSSSQEQFTRDIIRSRDTPLSPFASTSLLKNFEVQMRTFSFGPETYL